MRGDVAPLKRMLPRAGRHDVQDHAGQRRLAAARLADDREDLRPLGGELEAHVVDGARCVAAEQPADGVACARRADSCEQWRGHCVLAGAPQSRRRDARRHRLPSAAPAAGRCPSPAGSAGGSGSRSAARPGSAARPPGLRAVRRRRCAAGWRSGARCRDGAARGRARPWRASSTSRPAYITPSRSHRWACTAMSWVTKISDDCSLALHLADHRRARPSARSRRARWSARRR